MADKNDKNEFNVPGKFYVDSQCIGCALCASTAEGLFAISDTGCAYVAKQPASDEETALCTEAMESCPVNAIGNDKKGRIYIDYYTRDDLDRIAEILEFVQKNDRPI